MPHEDRTASSDARPNLDGGRPTHPLIAIAEAFVEAIAGVDNDADILDHIARLNVEVAKIADLRARRLRERVRPEILRGAALAETLVAERAA